MSIDLLSDLVACIIDLYLAFLFPGKVNPADIVFLLGVQFRLLASWLLLGLFNALKLPFETETVRVKVCVGLAPFLASHFEECIVAP